MGRWFERGAEWLARAIGTGEFILAQTIVVIAWVALNVTAIIHEWDPYPFILLNLAFSTQAAYATPLILFAERRQVDRDRATALEELRQREHEAERNAQVLSSIETLAELIFEHIHNMEE